MGEGRVPPEGRGRSLARRGKTKKIRDLNQQSPDPIGAESPVAYTNLEPSQAGKGRD